MTASIPSAATRASAPPSRNEETRHGPRPVHRLVESEGPAPVLRGRYVCDQRIAGRRADTLADPVEHADGQHQRPTGGEEQEGLGQARQTVTPEGQALLPAAAICEHPETILNSVAALSARPSISPMMPVLTPRMLPRNSDSVRMVTSLLMSLSRDTTPSALTVGSRGVAVPAPTPIGGSRVSYRLMAQDGTRLVVQPFRARTSADGPAPQPPLTESCGAQYSLLVGALLRAGHD